MATTGGRNNEYNKFTNLYMHFFVVSLMGVFFFQNGEYGAKAVLYFGTTAQVVTCIPCDAGCESKAVPECGTVPLSRLQLLSNLTNDSTNGPEVNGQPFCHCSIQSCLFVEAALDFALSSV